MKCLKHNPAPNPQPGVLPSRMPFAPGWIWLAVAWLSLGAWRAPGAEAPEMRQVAAARLPLALLRSPEVQAELGLPADQVGAIEAILEKADGPLWRLHDAPAAPGAERVRALAAQAMLEVDAVLKPGQRQRLDQLCLRAGGWEILQATNLLDRLQLSEAQHRRFEDFFAAQGKADSRVVRELPEAGQRWVLAILTGPQRALLSEALGQPFPFGQGRYPLAKAPPLREIEAWINTAPVRLSDWEGKVVILHFWTFGCINCVHNFPLYVQWFREFPPDRVAMLGVHTPETDGEHDLAALKRSVQERGLKFPIAVDNHQENWSAWGNHIWPAVYLIDKRGYVRCWWYGELAWRGAKGDAALRSQIQQLLAEDYPLSRAREAGRAGMSPKPPGS